MVLSTARPVVVVLVVVGRGFGLELGRESVASIVY